MLYTLKGFGPVKYVGIYGDKIGSSPVNEYESTTGLEVRIWLQKYEFNEWRWEVDGPHFFIDAATPDFQLTCAMLSASTSNFGPGSRFFSSKKQWRIGRVQVGSEKPIETGDYIRLEVWIDNQY